MNKTLDELCNEFEERCGYATELVDKMHFVTTFLCRKIDEIQARVEELEKGEE